jgi:hypothetical protein
MAGYGGGAFDRDLAVWRDWEAEVLRIALLGEPGPYAGLRLNTGLGGETPSPLVAL